MSSVSLVMRKYIVTSNKFSHNSINGIKILMRQFANEDSAPQKADNKKSAKKQTKNEAGAKDNDIERANVFIRTIERIKR